jgi:hypothetical protein
VRNVASPPTLFLDDLWLILRAQRRWLFYLTVGGAALGMLWRLQLPAMYEAKGTFRQEMPKSSGLTKLLEGELSLSNRGGPDPTLVMNSRTLVERLVERECLQAQLVERRSPITRLGQKLFWEAAWWLQSEEQERAYPHVRCTQVDYPQFKQLTLRICADRQGYTVLHKGTTLGSGRWGEPFVGEGYRFVLEAQQLLGVSEWDLTLLPKRKAVKSYQKQIIASNKSKQSNLVVIRALHHQPHEAAGMANGLMSAYRDYLVGQEEERLKERMAYLSKRQDENRHQMRDLMTQYAQRLSERATSAAFMGLDAELKFVAERQEKTLEKLLAVELQLQQLDGLAPRDAIHLVGGSQAQVASALVHELHQHQLQTAMLDQSLSHAAPMARLQEERQAELARAQAEIQHAIASLDQDDPEMRGGPLTTSWWQELDQAQMIAQSGTEADRELREKEVARQKRLFREYLKQTDTSLQLQQQLLQEAALDSHAFDGLEPQTITGLYLQYEQQQREAEVRQQQSAFLLEQISQGNWEGAGAVQAIDPGLAKLLDRATNLQLKIGNSTHYSPKEIAHFEEEYTRLGALLAAQLRQQSQLEQLRVQLIQSKLWELRRLQHAWLGQRMQLMDQQIGQCVASARHALTNEQKLLRQQISDMATTLRTVPEQWVDEQEIHNSSEVASQVFAHTVEVTEGQMLAHHLEQMEARPLDTALVPLKPVPPHLLLGTLAGALGALLGGSSLLVGWRFLRGLPTSRTQLQRLGATVLGSINHAGLRQAAAFLDALPKSTTGRVASVLSHADTTAQLAQILTTMGARCLVIETSFQTPASNSLLTYLEGHIAEPAIANSRILAGGPSELGFELLKSPAMHSLIDRLRDQYDWVFLYSSAPLGSVEHLALTPLADATLVTVQAEPLDAVTPYINSKTAFLIL